MPSAATTSWPRRTGTPTEQAPRLISSTVVAWSSRSTAASWRWRVPGWVIVYAVMRVRSASTARCTSGGRVGQQHLADPGRVHRQPAADGADDRHRRAAAQPVDVQHLGALAHREVHGGERGAVQVVEVRRGQLDQPGLVRRQQPEVPEPPADHVVAGRGAGQRAPLDQLADQPVRGRHRQPGALGELGEGQPAVLLVEGADQRQRPAGDRGAGRGHVPGHWASLFHWTDARPRFRSVEASSVHRSVPYCRGTPA